MIDNCGLFEVIECGSDESGKGDYFGGLAVCSVALTQQHVQKLQLLNDIMPPIGIRRFPSNLIIDSKEFKDDAVEFWVENYLQNIFEGHYCTIYLNAEEYNSEFKKTKNLNHILAKLHNRAWWELAGKVKVTNSIIDQFTPEHLYKKYLRELNENIFFISHFEVKAEKQFRSVGIASLFARYKILQDRAQLYRKYGVRVPAGISYEGVNDAVPPFKQLIECVGIKNIHLFCKVHFVCTKKLISLIGLDNLKG